MIKSDRFSQLDGLAWVAAECVVFVVVYFVALRVISPDWYRSVHHAVGGVLVKARSALRKPAESATVEVSTPGL